MSRPKYSRLVIPRRAREDWISGLISLYAPLGLAEEGRDLVACFRNPDPARQALAEAPDWGQRPLRVGVCEPGGFSRQDDVADQGQLLPMPNNMSYEDGAAFTMTYGTSYYALKQRSDYKPGETLLVTGASGGVGLTAVELGALMGLKVIAAVGSDEKMEVCRKYGATMFVNYAKEKMRDKVKELTGGNGADIIYDAVGGDAFDESIRCIAWYGRLLVVGFAAGRIPQLPANLALLKSCDVRGVFYGAWRAREPDEARKNFDELLAWYGKGKLKPHISMRFPLEKGAEAMNALLSRKATGKVVLTVA